VSHGACVVDSSVEYFDDTQRRINVEVSISRTPTNPKI